MKKKIVVINGSAGVGKDTFVEQCRHAFGPEVIGNFSSVDKVKEIAKMCGWNGEKTEIARKFLSDLKDLTENFNNMPYESMRERIREFNTSDITKVLFLHVREPKQIKQLQEEFGAISLLITRDGHKQVVTNHADANVYNYTYDYTIANDGTVEELVIKAKDFIEMITAA